jgi:hypothetical protein
VTGSIVTDKPFDIIVYPLLVVLLLDQLLGFTLTWIGYSNTIIYYYDQGCIDRFGHNELTVPLK